MKAISTNSFGGPEELHLCEIASPAPGPYEVLVEVRAIGVNPADTYMLTGNYVFLPELPYIPGGDCAGVITAVGSKVTDLKKGTRVFINAALSKNLTGCYAEFVVRPAEEAVPFPDNISFEQAAGIGLPYLTAHYALFSRGRAAYGETVFIHGASGAVGAAAIQLAKLSGLRVIGSAGSKQGLARINDLGVDIALDHTAKDYLVSLQEATNFEGPELILEMLADVNLGNDIKIVGKFGRIVIIGCRGDVPISPRLAMMKELDILGTAIWNLSTDQIKKNLNDLVTMMAEGRVVPFIGQKFPLENASEAHHAIMAPGTKGKIILVV